MQHLQRRHRRRLLVAVRQVLAQARHLQLRKQLVGRPVHQPA